MVNDKAIEILNDFIEDNQEKVPCFYNFLEEFTGAKQTNVRYFYNSGFYKNNAHLKKTDFYKAI